MRYNHMMQKGLSEVRIDARGQITIPATLRKKLGITAKTPIHIDEQDGRIILQPITREYIHSIRGMYKDLPLMVDIKRMRAEDQRRDERKLKLLYHC
jgi:AbrB family looped-hinge helix DNA binding protein